MEFDIFFNLLGLTWPFKITIEKKRGNLVAYAVAESGGSKILAIKILRNSTDEYMSLREAKNMIEEVW